MKSAGARRGRLGLPLALMLAATLLLMAGCATPAPPASPAQALQSQGWSGRLSLQVESDPPKQYSAGFELSGDAQAGELRLSSPFGQLLALAQWREGHAMLQRGEQQQTYPDLDTLTTELVGATVPVTALFDWLRGRATEADGWQVDLADLAAGRLRAQRLHPAPAASLRIVIR